MYRLRKCVVPGKLVSLLCLGVEVTLGRSLNKQINKVRRVLYHLCMGTTKRQSSEVPILHTVARSTRSESVLFGTLNRSRRGTREPQKVKCPRSKLDAKEYAHVFTVLQIRVSHG